MDKIEYLSKWKVRKEMNEVGREMYRRGMVEALAIMLYNDACECIELNSLPSWCPSCEDFRYKERVSDKSSRSNLDILLYG